MVFADKYTIISNAVHDLHRENRVFEYVKRNTTLFTYKGNLPMQPMQPMQEGRHHA